MVNPPGESHGRSVPRVVCFSCGDPFQTIRCWFGKNMVKYGNFAEIQHGIAMHGRCFAPGFFIFSGVVRSESSRRKQSARKAAEVASTVQREMNQEARWVAEVDFWYLPSGNLT